MSLLNGKKAIILGLANERSIAWGVAKGLKEHGAKLAFSYMNDALKKRVLPLAGEIGADFTFELDVTQNEHLLSMKKSVEDHWGQFDILIHSLAFAEKKDLSQKFIHTSREGFSTSLDVSAYSLVAITETLSELLNDGGSIMSMTYYGSQKVVTNYNVMGVAKAALESATRYLAADLGPRGIRVNCLSAGPIKTLAASGISGFRGLLSQVENISPMKRNVTAEDCGGAAVFLASDLSRGVTGQVIYVDSGLHIMGGF